MLADFEDMNMRHSPFYTVLIAILPIVACQAAEAAPVTTCDALAMYGWGANSGTCMYLSPGTQNHWICGLTANGANPDVHTTFNATDRLHMTVNNLVPPAPQCHETANLGGTFPGNLTFDPAPPNNALCGVAVAARLNALNAIQQPTLRCKDGFVAAGTAGIIDQQMVTSYVDLCKKHRCPN